MARNTAQTIEKPPVRRRANQKLENVTPAPVVRSTRGRKAEAIKELIPPTIKKYRTRKDYMGDGWSATVNRVTPHLTRPNLEPTETVKKVTRKTAMKTTEVKDDKVTSEKAPLQVNTRLSNGTNVDFAHGLMDLCTKHMMLLNGIFGGIDGVAEIDIHIKVKPTTALN
jgi:hypothetical protein